MFANMCFVDINLTIVDLDLCEEEFDFVVLRFGRFGVVKVFVCTEEAVREVFEGEY